MNGKKRGVFLSTKSLENEFKKEKKKWLSMRYFCRRKNKNLNSLFEKKFIPRMLLFNLLFHLFGSIMCLAGVVQLMASEKEVGIVVITFLVMMLGYISLNMILGCFEISVSSRLCFCGRKKNVQYYRISCCVQVTYIILNFSRLFLIIASASIGPSSMNEYSSGFVGPTVIMISLYLVQTFFGVVLMILPTSIIFFIGTEIVRLIIVEDRSRELCRFIFQFFAALFASIICAIVVFYRERTRRNSHFVTFFMSRLERKTKDKSRITSLLIDLLLPKEFTSILVSHFQKKKYSISTLFHREKHEKNVYCQIDLVDFCVTSRNFDPRALVKILDFLYSSFDSCCEKYHFNKIKSEGDAYICASNNYDERDRGYSLLSACLFCLNLLRSVKKVDLMEINTRYSQELQESTENERMDLESPKFLGRVGCCVDSGTVVLFSDRDLVRFDTYGRGIKKVALLEQYAKTDSVCVDRTIYEAIIRHGIDIFEVEGDESTGFGNDNIGPTSMGGQGDPPLESPSSLPVLSQGPVPCGESVPPNLGHKPSSLPSSVELIEIDLTEQVELIDLNDPIHNENMEIGMTNDPREQWNHEEDVIHHDEDLGMIEGYNVRNTTVVYNKIFDKQLKLKYELGMPLSLEESTLFEDHVNSLVLRSPRPVPAESRASIYAVEFQSDQSRKSCSENQTKKMEKSKSCLELEIISSCLMKYVRVHKCCFFFLFSYCIFHFPLKRKFIKIHFDHISHKTFMFSWIICFFMGYRNIFIHVYDRVDPNFQIFSERFHFINGKEPLLLSSISALYLVFVLLFSLIYVPFFHYERIRKLICCFCLLCHKVFIKNEKSSDPCVQYDDNISPTNKQKSNQQDRRRCVKRIICCFICDCVCLRFLLVFCFSFMIVLYLSFEFLMISTSDHVREMNLWFPMLMMIIFLRETYFGVFGVFTNFTLFFYCFWFLWMDCVHVFSLYSLFRLFIAPILLGIFYLLKTMISENTMLQFYKETNKYEKQMKKYNFEEEKNFKIISSILPNCVINDFIKQFRNNAFLIYSCNGCISFIHIYLVSLSSTSTSTNQNPQITTRNNNYVRSINSHENDDKMLEYLNEVFGIIDRCCWVSGCQKIRTSSNKYIAISADLYPDGITEREKMKRKGSISVFSYSSNAVEEEEEEEKHDESSDHYKNMAKFTVSVKRRLLEMNHKEDENEDSSCNRFLVEFKIGFCYGNEFVAGIIGSKGFNFDVLGSDVNLASRCCTAIEERNKIQFCGEEIHRKLEDDYKIVQLGEMFVKGFGMKNMYLLDENENE